LIEIQHREILQNWAQEFCQNVKKFQITKLFLRFCIHSPNQKKMEFRNHFLDQKFEKAEKIEFHERQSFATSKVLF